MESTNSLNNLDNVNVTNSPKEGSKALKRRQNKQKKFGLENIPEEIWEKIDWFHRKQEKGYIDVWWLYDDGGE